MDPKLGSRIADAGRVALLPLGIQAMITLLSQTPPLPWTSSYAFDLEFFAAFGCAAAGAWLFVAHWKHRAIAPALIILAAIALAIVPKTNSLIISSILLLAFAVSANVVAPRELEADQPPTSTQHQWEPYSIPRPLGSRGQVAINTAIAPGQKFTLRWGEFQEIKWAAAEVQVRVDHLGLLSRGRMQYAVKQKIVVQTEVGHQLSLVFGADIIQAGQPNEYIVPISQVGLAHYSTMPGSIAYIGNPLGHYPDFAAFTMCVRKINSETGEADIEAFFGGKLQ